MSATWQCFSFIDTQCQQHDTVLSFYWHTMSATWHSSAFLLLTQCQQHDTVFPFYWCTMSATWHSVSLLLTHNANMTQCFTFIDAQCQQHECFPVIDTQCQQYDTVVLSFYWHTMSATWHSASLQLTQWQQHDTVLPFIGTQCQQHDSVSLLLIHNVSNMSVSLLLTHNASNMTQCFSFIDTQCQQHDTVVRVPSRNPE